MEKTEVGWKEVKEIVNSAPARKGFAERLVSERMVRSLSMSGTTEDCLEKLESFAGTGLDVPIFYIHGPSPDRALDLAGEEILPKIQG